MFRFALFHVTCLSARLYIAAPPVIFPGSSTGIVGSATFAPMTHTNGTPQTFSSIQMLHAIYRPANGLFVGRRVTTADNFGVSTSSREDSRFIHKGYAWDAVILFRKVRTRAIYLYSIERPTLVVSRRRRRARKERNGADRTNGKKGGWMKKISSLATRSEVSRK